MTELLKIVINANIDEKRQKLHPAGTSAGALRDL